MSKIVSRGVWMAAVFAAAVIAGASPATAQVATGTCATGGAAGASNASAYNAGYYDGMCGDYVWFGYGYNYNGYCANAKSYAASQNLGTVSTGACANGTVYNHYAGGYHSQCRYWEYYGYGYDHNGYCGLAAQYVTAGACTGCGL